MLGVTERMDEQGCTVMCGQLALNVFPKIVKEQKVVTFKLLLVDLHILAVIVCELFDGVGTNS
jgi:hypothetical protein